MYICPMEWSDLHVEMEWNGTNLTEWNEINELECELEWKVTRAFLHVEREL